jgi:hypothetical protein
MLTKMKQVTGSGIRFSRKNNVPYTLIRLVNVRTKQK